ncbi:non-hydrolyzing UDP-N-acetylglucosamine 2-epimerase [Rosistilla oblonga]|uniref:non-hydrolyzing UDP-N-acetylglucosamine 2-epimerase n=1 Tax=Rosistilla oblonga TaxID=2527990 RepID=UPI003A9804FE
MDRGKGVRRIQVAQTQHIEIMLTVDIIAGARPNFMKIAPIVHAIDADQSSIEYRLIHTGQHYDAKMSGDFFTQLGIPEPHYNLGAGSGSQAEQTGAIMRGYEQVLQTKPSDLCLVVGDVTSTMACAIVAKKAGIDVAHVEAGIRSGDRTMPEEINRLVTDAITDYFFTTSAKANESLRTAGIDDSAIFFVGNTMIDTLLKNIDRLRKPDFFDEQSLISGNYIVITLHRPANVDKPENLATMLNAIAESANGLPVIFPVHPRTRKNLEQLPQLPECIHVVDPQPYLQFIYLVKNAKAVLTDSGGITEETTVLGVPCMTLRDSTERPETVTMGTNELIGTSVSNIPPAMQRLLAGQWKSGQVPPKWDGKTGARIVEILKQLQAASQTRTNAA